MQRIRMEASKEFKKKLQEKKRKMNNFFIWLRYWINIIETINKFK